MPFPRKTVTLPPTVLMIARSGLPSWLKSSVAIDVRDGAGFPPREKVAGTRNRGRPQKPVAFAVVTAPAQIKTREADTKLLRVFSNLINTVLRKMWICWEV
jgi:hypothetical protein